MAQRTSCATKGESEALARKTVKTLWDSRRDRNEEKTQEEESGCKREREEGREEKENRGNDDSSHHTVDDAPNALREIEIAVPFGSGAAASGPVNIG